MGRLVASVLAAVLLIAALVQPAMGAAGIDGLRVTRAEAHKLVLNWIPEPDAQTYDVIQDGAVVGTSDDTWFVATGLDELTDYSFVVRSNTGAESATATFTTAPVTPPRTSIDIWWIGPKGVRFLFGDGEFEVRRDGVVIAERSGQVFEDTALNPDTTYIYEVRAIGAAGNLGPPVTQPITTKSLLPQIQGVQAELVEPGLVNVSWQALDATTRYRVFVDGELATPATPRGATSLRIDVTPGTTSVIQVAGYNGGGGPLSAPVTVTSDQIDPRQIGLEVNRSWPGTVVLNWRHNATSETVLFDGVAVGTANRGWITVDDLPYNTIINVSVLTETNDGQVESIAYPIRTASLELNDVRNFRSSQISTDSVKLNWRRSAWVDYEITRNGVPIAIIGETDPVPFFDTDVSQGMSYTYSVRQVAVVPGATGVSNPVSLTVTTPGVANGVTPDAPSASASFADNSRVVIKVTLANGDQQSYHQQLEIFRDGVSIGMITPPESQQFAYFVDKEVDRDRAAEYTVVSLSPSGERSSGTSVQVAPRPGVQTASSTS